MSRSTGAARALLLGLLGLAVAITAVSLWVLVTSSDTSSLREKSDGDEGEPGDADAVDLPPLHTGNPAARRSKGEGTRIEVPEGDEDDMFVPGGRIPDGPIFTVDDDSLRLVFKARHWEEIRRQIDVLESESKPLPDDVVRALLAMLEDDGTRLDAVLALGQVKNDTSVGLALAQIAADKTADAESRAAALQSLAKSGQSAGLEFVRPLVEGEDGPVTRQALFALAAMGGDAVPVLLSALSAHADDALTDAVLGALARSNGSDAALATEWRSARDAGAVAKLELLLRVGSQMGANGGEELAAEVKKIVDAGGPPQLEGVDEEARARIFASALNVAAGFGGAGYESVVRVAMDRTGADREMALYALRNGRGNVVADALAGAVSEQQFAAQDAHVRWSLANAFGATRSPRAAPRLVKMLDDEDSNVRSAAAAALGQIGDMESSKPLLDKLEKSLADFDFSRTLIQAIGRTLDKSALPRLRPLLDKDHANRDFLTPYLRQAIYRIESGNADATLMSAEKPK